MLKGPYVTRQFAPRLFAVAASIFLIFGLVLGLAARPAQAAEKALNGLPLGKPTAVQSKASKAIGWKGTETPTAPVGFKVTRFAGDLKNPRWIYQGPNGDIFVAESDSGMGSANRITLFRDANSDGVPELKKTFKVNLSSPFGMLIHDGYFYVANTGNVTRFKYTPGQIELEGNGTKILEIPTGHHWTRNIIASADGKKLLVSVGSGSNIAEGGIEEEKRRACILEINPDGSGEKIFASGLRNPVGMGIAPGTSTLFTAVNERDNLGDDLVPDYMTSVKEGGFYGWPYTYYGQNVDSRVQPQNPELVKKALVPDVALGAHTASLGLAFYSGTQFPAKYQGGAFIGQHGSWNRSKYSGYRVAFVPFKAGKPSGPPEDFLTGFIADEAKGEVHGRPVGTAVLKDGSLLVADDDGNTVWRVTHQ